MSDVFKRSYSKQCLQTLGENEKLLVMTNFSFYHYVFNSIPLLFNHTERFPIYLQRCFQLNSIIIPISPFITMFSTQFHYYSITQRDFPYICKDVFKLNVEKKYCGHYFFHKFDMISINPFPLTPAQQTAFWKHGHNRRNCSKRAISPLVTMFWTEFNYLFFVVGKG